MNYMNISELEELIGYTFKRKGLLLQAFVHPSFNKHSGGCYQVWPFFPFYLIASELIVIVKNTLTSAYSVHF